MAFSELEISILSALEAEAGPKGIDIVDVEVVGASKAPCVRVRIDHLDPEKPTITLDEVCEQNEWIDAVLDSLDPIPSSYSLEVSSPGLARPLRRASDFARFVGEQCSVTTTATEGRKKFTGEILAVSDESVKLKVDSDEIEIALAEIKQAKLKPTF